MSNPDITALAIRARARDYSSIALVVARLESLVNRNDAYLARRRGHGRHTTYDDALTEDNEVIALAIVLLESAE